MPLGPKVLHFKDRKANPGEVEIIFLCKMCCVWTCVSYQLMTNLSHILLEAYFNYIEMCLANGTISVIYLMKCPHSHLQVQATFILAAG